MPWPVEHVAGSVAELHARSADLVQVPDGGRRRLLVVHPVDEAIVLGSTQAELVVDRDACTAAGVQVVRRRTGGGAVLVEPGPVLWVDLFLPVGDPLWQTDVGRAAWWLGEVWAAGLAAAGLGHPEVWKGPMQRRPWSSLVCFAGLAAGEVTLAGRKAVGISQRRTRAGALLQCACLLRWEPARLLALLALTPQDRAEALEAVSTVAHGVGEDKAEAILDGVLAALP
jgi:lipoate-protein ligase A